MKSLATALPIVLALSSLVCDGAFTPEWIRAFQGRPMHKKWGHNSHHQQQYRRSKITNKLAEVDDQEDDSAGRKAPHPPETSPPEQLLRDEMFFATRCDPDFDAECEPDSDDDDDDDIAVDKSDSNVNSITTADSMEMAAQAARKAGQVVGTVTVRLLLSLQNTSTSIDDFCVIEISYQLLRGLFVSISICNIRLHRTSYSTKR